jgi:serine/threonine protein kinase
MGSLVESLCNDLARSRLLAPDRIRDLRQRWLQTAGPLASDGEKFAAWLTVEGAVTEYQLGFLQRGHAEQLFLGPYIIRERIAKGQMAGVYRAVHETGQIVALKILPPSKAKDPQLLGRFQREARLAVRLKHPNVVRTFQTGESGGLYYLVMELLEGEALDEVFARRGPLPPAEAVRLIHQALLGLQHLHEQGLIHRDLKPANLLLVGARPESTLQGTVKIVDIGTGRALFDDGPGNELTNEGDLLGTPAYLAPEQARDPRSADIRADIYSLGCVLYHALAGKPPFTDTSPVRLLVRHASETPLPLRQLNSAVPDGLQRIVDGMLAKDPASRYATPERAAAALATFQAAGAQVVPLDQDPRMAPYLRWLSGKAEGQPAVPVAMPVATSGPTPRPSPSVPVVEAEYVPESTVPVVEVEIVPQPAARVPPPPPIPGSRPPPPPMPRAAGRPKPPPPPVRRDEEEDEAPSGLGRRDFLMLAIGVGGLAVAISGGLAIWSIVRHHRHRAEDDDNKEKEASPPADAP